MSAKSENDKSGEGAAEAPPKSKKMLLIAAIAGLVLVLAAAGGWFYMSRQQAALDEDEEEVTQKEAAAPKGPPTYLPLDTMVVNLADPGGERVAQIGVVLELSNPKAPDRVKPYLPAIRNSVLLLVSQRKAEELLTPEGKGQLMADILAATDTHFPGAPKGKGKKKKDEAADDAGNPVRAVLFSSLIVQ